MNLKIKVLGVNQAINNIENYMKRKHAGLLGAVAESSASIKSEARSLTPVDLGDLRDSINYTVKDRKNVIEGDILADSSYAAYVEFPTRPHWAPREALQGWADRHGIPVYAVQRAIAEKGTLGKPYMAPAAAREKPKFIRAVRRVMSSP